MLSTAIPFTEQDKATKVGVYLWLKTVVISILPENLTVVNSIFGEILTLIPIRRPFSRTLGSWKHLPPYSQFICFLSFLIPAAILVQAKGVRKNMLPKVLEKPIIPVLMKGVHHFALLHAAASIFIVNQLLNSPVISLSIPWKIKFYWRKRFHRSISNLSGSPPGSCSTSALR